MTNVIDLLQRLENDDEYLDLRVKPALLTLLVDQAELLDASITDGDPTYDLRSGFPSVQSLVSWYQRAAVRTLGHIADYWEPISCVADDTLLDAMIIRDTSGFSPEKADRYRGVVEAISVQPACNRAYEDLRGKAAEYIRTPDSDGGQAYSSKELQPATQANLAMRPGFQELDRQQHRALSDLWGGFDSRSDLLNWLHGLNSPSNGEIRSDLAQSVMTDDVALARLLHQPDTDRAHVYQAVFACVDILPAFVRGVKSTDTGELAKATRTAPTTARLQ